MSYDTVLWDETLIATSFEKQLSLLENSINSPKGGDNPRKKNKKQTKKDTSLKFSNKSQLFRFQTDDMSEKETKQKEVTKPLPGPAINIMPPPNTTNLAKPEGEQDAHASMLMAWYVAGYHTGYYEAVKNFQNK